MTDLERAAQRIAAQLAPPQLRFITDPERWRIACCSKQSGKNFAVSRLMVLVALDRPGAQVAYVNATFSEGRRIMWTDTLDGVPAVLRSLDIPFRENASLMELTLSNGSIIRILGADRDAWNRLLGQRYDLIVGDELQKMDDAGLRRALFEVIPDRLSARGGSFVGIGTPDEFCVGVFHDIVEGEVDPLSGRRADHGFGVHRWTARDLADRTGVWAEQLAWKERFSIADDDPRWLRDKLGLWVRDGTRLMHDVDGRGAVWDGQLPGDVVCSDGLSRVPRSLPLVAYGGIDFGFTDSTALVVATISREEGIGREAYSGKRSGINTARISEWMSEVERSTGVKAWYGDNAAAQTIADLNQLYGHDVRPCEKTERNFWHGELDAAFEAGEWLVRDGSVLHKELQTLVRDPDALLRRSIEPRPGSDDHAYDAWRYLFRAVRTHHVKQPERPRTSGEREADEIAALKRRMMSRR